MILLNIILIADLELNSSSLMLKKILSMRLFPFKTVFLDKIWFPTVATVVRCSLRKNKKMFFLKCD